MISYNFAEFRLVKSDALLAFYSGERMVLKEETKSSPNDVLAEDLLHSLDNLSGLHAGFRPVHAKGLMCSGTFTPSAEAIKLTRAPHITKLSTPVILRFSNFGGVPNIPDNDANASPRGIAIRFYLAEHIHTDIIGHSHNGFPTRTGEEFLELLKALAASGPDTPKPTPLDLFFSKYPKAMQFFQTPNPIPTSFAKESFFGVTAFKFTNQQGISRYGRFQIRPLDGNEYLKDSEAEKKSANFLFDEIPQRLAKGPIKLSVLVQIAGGEDNISDSSVAWPDTREVINLGTVTLTERVDETAPDMRKIIFDPIPRVDGIDPSDDPLIAIRSALYLLSGRRRRAAET